MITVATALCIMFRAKLDSLEIMAAHASELSVVHIDATEDGLSGRDVLSI